MPQSGILQKLDLAIRLGEQHFDQVFGVHLGKCSAHRLRRCLHQRTDRLDTVVCFRRGRLDGAQQKQNPRFPGIVLGYLPQSRIVVTLVRDDVTTQLRAGTIEGHVETLSFFRHVHRTCRFVRHIVQKAGQEKWLLRRLKSLRGQIRFDLSSCDTRLPEALVSLCGVGTDIDVRTGFGSNGVRHGFVGPGGTGKPVGSKREALNTLRLDDRIG